MLNNKSNLEEWLDNHDSIYLYGAGNVAKAVIVYAREKEVLEHIKKIVVTDVTANPPEICGIPVASVWDCEHDDKYMHVLVAVLEKFQNSVSETLNILKISNIESVSDSLFNELSTNKEVKNSENNAKYKKIVFYAYRDSMMGISGGPGAALNLQEKFIGSKYKNIPIEYRYKSRKGLLRYFKDEYIGGIFQAIFEQLFSKKTFYICNDIGIACGLSYLKKPYSVIFHHQGPVVKENMDYGQKQSAKRYYWLKKIERNAFVNARKVFFPSKGAAEMYFSSEHRACERHEVNVENPLYNTISSIIVPKKVEPDPDKLTFFSLGTLSTAKGQDLSLLFIEELLQKYRGKVRYIICGRGPLINDINRKAYDLMNQHNNFEYIYIPRLDPYSEIIRIHQLSDVYLMMHRISIFDLSTLEAMSNRCALVLSNVGGNPEFNVNDNVLLVDENENKKAVDIFLSRNLEEWKRKNQEAYEQYFSNSSFRNAYLNMLESEIV